MSGWVGASVPLKEDARFVAARGRYIESLKSSFPRGLTLTGLKLEGWNILNLFDIYRSYVFVTLMAVARSATK